MSSIDDNINVMPKISKIDRNEMRDEEFENILENLEIQNSLRRSNTMCDITLVATDGVKIAAHKVILSSSSPFFLSKFNDEDFKEKNKQSIRIKEIDSNILETDILKASHLFQLNRLKEKCCNFIENNFNLKNCINIMKFAKLISYDRLYNLSFSYVLENFFNLEVSILYELSYDEIKTFISDNNLITESEEKVFEFVLNWTKYDMKNREKYFPELMKHIRLSFVPSTFLINVFNEPLLKDHKILEYIIKYLNEPDSKHERNPKLKNNEYFPNKSDILISIEYSKDSKIYYSDISSDLLDWNSGPDVFKPPIPQSKIIAFDGKFLFSIGGGYYNVSCYRYCDFSHNDCFILDLSTTSKQWIQTTSMLNSRIHHAVCTHNNRIFAIGGVDSNNKILNTIEVFDINTKLWTLYCTMSEGRKNCSAIYHNNFLHIIGGINNKDQVLSTIECFNDLSSTWNNYIDPLPQLFYNTCITIFKNDLYVIGGMNIFNGKTEESFNTIFKFTLSSGSGVWCTLPSLLEPRHLASCEVLDEKLYIFGGISNNSYAKSIEILDLKKNIITTEEIFMNCSSQNILKFNKQNLSYFCVKL